MLYNNFGQDVLTTVVFLSSSSLTSNSLMQKSQVGQ